MKSLGPVLLLLALTGCAIQERILERMKPPPPVSEVELRAYQSRVLDTGNQQEVLRRVLATLQDLDYQVVHVNPDLGVVGGTRRGERITVTVNARGEGQVLVRATVHGRRGSSRDYHQYQRFFAALEKSSFLSANRVE